MNNLFRLIGYEYKKIFLRKSFILVIVILLFVSTFCMVGNAIMGSTTENGKTISYLESIEREIELKHSVAGPLDDDMINDVIIKNVEARDKINEDGIYDDDIYYSSVAPYSSIRSFLARLLSPVEQVEFDNFNLLNSGEGIDFYSLRTEYIKNKAVLNEYSDAEIEAVLNRNEKLNTPFYYDYYQGYSTFLIMMSTSALFIVLAAVISIAPIFASEYSNKTDSLLLSSKHGKGNLIFAKLITAISFSLLLTVIGVIVAAITVFSVYSPIGGDVSLQLFNLNSVYSLTMIKAVIIHCIITVVVSVALSGVVALLSAKFSSYITVISMSLLLFGSMFLTIPNGNFRILNYALPAKMLDYNFIFNERLINIGGLYIEPYYFILALCVVITAIFSCFAFFSFKNHQAN